LMTGHMTATDPAFRQQLAAAGHYLARHTDPVTAAHQAIAVEYSVLGAQAHLWAFVDNFRLFALLSLACIPLIFIFKPPKRPPKPVDVH